jgi:hypothetical protein
MNEADNREARAGSVANWGPATISVPAEDLAGEVQAAHSVRARGKLHAARWHMEDVCSAISERISLYYQRRCLPVTVGVYVSVYAGDISSVGCRSRCRQRISQLGNRRVPTWLL